jgi:hypothetical protein
MLQRSRPILLLRALLRRRLAGQLSTRQQLRL